MKLVDLIGGFTEVDLSDLIGTNGINIGLLGFKMVVNEDD